MKLNWYIGCIFYMAVACNGKDHENQVIYATIQDSTLIEKSQQNVLINNKSIAPSRDLIELIHYMNSKSYPLDSASIGEKKFMDSGIIINIEEYTKSVIHDGLKDSTQFKNGHGNISLEFSPIYDKQFSKVLIIFTYTWRINDTPEGLERKGTVEEWHFLNENDAKYAYDFLMNEQKFIGFPYIKRPSFYWVCGTSLYIFHSPSSGVSYRNKPFFEWLKTHCTL